jgi:hypothetical protein
MADFNVSDVASKINPPQQISIGDMLNIARGAQAYKQAQEVNPELLRTAKAEAQTQEQTAATGDINLQKAIQENTERLAMQDFYSNPENYQTDGQFDLNKVNATIPKIAPLTGTKHIQSLTTIHKAQTEANEAAQGLDQKTTGIVAGALETLGYSEIQDPKVYKSELTRLKQKFPHNEKMTKYIDAQIETIDALPPGADLAKGAIVHANQLLTPEEQQSRFGKKMGTITSGGNIYETVSQNPPTNENPTIETYQTPIVNNPIGNQAPSSVKPPKLTDEDMKKSDYSRPPELKYPIRTPGAPVASIQGEEEDRTTGQAHRNNLIQAQANQTTQKRNLEEVLTTATKVEENAMGQGAGVFGAMNRNASAFWGTPLGQNYLRLSKDLANSAIANIKLTGGSMDTVAGQQLTRMANGDETYPPKIVKEIARRAQSDMGNIDMQATAAQKFANKFGDNNMKSFQQIWSKNADSRIFEALKINQSPISSEEKQAEYNRLFGQMTQKQIKMFKEKKQNIKKLVETGTL